MIYPAAPSSGIGVAVDMILADVETPKSVPALGGDRAPAVPGDADIGSTQPHRQSLKKIGRAHV